VEDQTLTLELGVGHVPVVLERKASRVVGGWFSRPAPLPVTFVHTDAHFSYQGLSRDYTVGDMRPPAPYRLYRASVSQHWVLDPDSGPDKRAEVTL
jgi:hypothetical protein